MRQALNALLGQLETALQRGEDPGPLLRNLRIADLVGWPEDRAAAEALRRRLAALATLVRGLERPLRATLLSVAGTPTYGSTGRTPWMTRD